MSIAVIPTDKILSYRRFCNDANMFKRLIRGRRVKWYVSKMRHKIYIILTCSINKRRCYGIVFTIECPFFKNITMICIRNCRNQRSSIRHNLSATAHSTAFFWVSTNRNINLFGFLIIGNEGYIAIQLVCERRFFCIFFSIECPVDKNITFLRLLTYINCRISFIFTGTSQLFASVNRIGIKADKIFCSRFGRHVRVERSIFKMRYESGIILSGCKLKIRRCVNLISVFICPIREIVTLIRIGNCRYGGFFSRKQRTSS